MSHRVRFPADHPALPGHFPGRPLVPGVVILESVMHAARDRLAAERGGDWRVGGVPNAKFLHPLDPETELIIEFRGEPDRLGFQARLADGTPVAKGTLRCEAE